MHERQAIVVIAMLFFSGIFVSESFAQIQQCNGLDATRVGTEGRDFIRGSSGDDVIVALGGNDLIFGNGGNDVICGGDGNDRIYGNSGDDLLIGQAGSDKLNGGSGDDSCDSTSEDRKISCEEQYQEHTTNNDNDLQKQINDLQTQINNIIFGLINWSDIQGVPESLADGDDDMLAKIECKQDQILVFDGDSWVCDDVKLVSNTAQSCQGDLVNFAGLSHGDDLNEIQKYLEPFGISLSANGNGKDSIDTVIIYDSDIDDGKDSDLEVGIGKLAIIPDNIHKPSDSAKGGEQAYDFEVPRNVRSIEIVDIESDEAGTITALNEKGEVIGVSKLPVTGNKGHKTVMMNYPNVSKLVIDYNSSGAVTNLCFSENDELANLECEENQILVFDGKDWVCGDNIADRTDTLTSLDCNIDEIVKWNGSEWQCSKNITESTPMSFHFSTVGIGGTVWSGSADTVFDIEDSQKPEILITTSGTITNLIAKTTAPMQLSPPENESYSITLVKNGEDTSLTCIISSNQDTCDDLESEVIVAFGDTVVLKVKASQFAPFAIIRSSILFSSD